MRSPSGNAPPTEQKLASFRSPDLPIEQRIDGLLGLMTLDEKLDCLSTNPSIERLGVRASGHVEGLHGLALGGPGRWGRDQPVPTTTFPQAIGLAETWDPELVQQVARVEAIEARYVFHHPRYRRGGLVVRAPNADLGRDPRWGRTEECYGEDAYFNGTMAVAFVRGLHGDGPVWRAASLLKHFLANSNEDGRESSSSDFDARLWREYYSVPFRMAIEEGGARAFMTAYNAHNGIPCATHPMLADVAVAEWHQDGIICTDGGAFRLLVHAHGHFPDLEHAAKAALDSGITQFLDDYRGSVQAALEAGLLTVADIDRALRPNFRVMIRLGLLDPPGSSSHEQISEDTPEPWTTAEHQALVRTVTHKSAVLLKNDRDLLPLDPANIDSLAVIGPLADRVLVDWYSGTPDRAVSPLEGIRDKVGDSVLVRSSTNNDISDARRLAQQSDVCIVCVGNHPTGDAPWAKVVRPSYGKEAVDRQSIDLEDEALIRDLFQYNSNMVVVLISSFPYAIAWTQQNVPAILHFTHNSQDLGHALADVLFGDFNPGGRLVQTWPRSLDQLPPMMDYDIRHGRTYMYFEGAPLYPFGFGLSYTTFSYGRPRFQDTVLPSDGTAAFEVDLTNTGTRDGDEVLQVYARYVESQVSRPLQQLVAFRRVTVPRGATVTVEFALKVDQLATWNEQARAFVVEPGRVELGVGRSSAHIEHRFEITLVPGSRARVEPAP